jgi:hypothetical protein
MVVLAGLTLSASESLAFTDAPVGDPTAAGLELPAALPFIQAAPSPFLLMLVGSLMVAVTFGRRHRRATLRAGA